MRFFRKKWSGREQSEWWTRAIQLEGWFFFGWALQAMGLLYYFGWELGGTGADTGNRYYICPTPFQLFWALVGWQINLGRKTESHFMTPSKHFSLIQSYCSRLSVSLLSYRSRATLLQLDHRNKFERDHDLFSAFCLLIPSQKNYAMQNGW